MTTPVSHVRVHIQGPQTHDSSSESAPADAPQLLPAAGEATLPVLGRLHLLMIKSSRQKREADRLSEEQFEVAEQRADDRRLKEMKDKADSALTTGLLTAGMQFASATASAVSSVSTLSKMAARDAAVSKLAAADRDLHTAANINRVEDRQAIPGTVERLADVRVAANENLRAAERALATTEQVGKVVDASGKATEAASKGIEALSRASGDRAQVRITELENQSKAARRAADRLKSEQEAAKQSEAKITQLAQEISQAQQQCERAALLRM